MTTVTVRSRHNYQQEISTGDHFLFADEPISLGGDNTGPNPYELLLAALGACTSITLQMYAQRKGWTLEGVEVELTHRKDYAADCADCEKETARIDAIEVKVSVRGELSPEQREKLMYIATRCPVNKTLSSGIKVVHTEAVETAG